MTLNARTLYRIATALDLQWRPASNSDQITIRREANIVTTDIIERSLRSALKEKGVQGNYKVEFNRDEPTIVLPNTMSERAEIVDLKYNPQRDYFQADVVAPSADNPLKKISVTGQIKRMIKVPVLRNTLQNGDIIGANDINFIDVEEQTLQHDVILHANDMVGLTPRRIAYAGKLILQGTLGKPQLVTRGDAVNITFREGPLVLTAKGKALQSGAKGDLVRVTNTNSSRTVDAFITGENQVAVR
jgi:flagella basal body P-ring formation protein FlgA